MSLLLTYIIGCALSFIVAKLVAPPPVTTIDKIQFKLAIASSWLYIIMIIGFGIYGAILGISEVIDENKQESDRFHGMHEKDVE
jgi:hypothetical protein